MQALYRTMHQMGRAAAQRIVALSAWGEHRPRGRGGGPPHSLIVYSSDLSQFFIRGFRHHPARQYPAWG
jgi:hypothetical protein